MADFGTFIDNVYNFYLEILGKLNEDGQHNWYLLKIEESQEEDKITLYFSGDDVVKHTQQLELPSKLNIDMLYLWRAYRVQFPMYNNIITYAMYNNSITYAMKLATKLWKIKQKDTLIEIRDILNEMKEILQFQPGGPEATMAKQHFERTIINNEKTEQ